MKDLVTTIAVYPLGIIYVASLVFAINSSDPWLYHPIFILLLLLPSIFAFVFSKIGQNSDPNNRFEKLSNAVGRFGFVTLGLLLLVCYAWALWFKT